MQTRQLTTTGNTTRAITRTETAALERLLPEHRKLIQAGLQPTLSQLQAINALDLLTDTVNMAYSLCGQKPDMETVAVTVNELYTRLMETYPHCTVEEVRTAIRNGVFDEYGEYFGLNVKTFVMFIRAYLFSEQRRAAKAAFTAARHKEEKPETETSPYWDDSYWTPENTGLWQQITENAYSRFCEGSILSGFVQEGSYWLLKRSGAFTVPDDYKTQLIERAIQTMRAELIKNEGKKRIREIKEMLEQLQSPDDYPGLKRYIHFRAKRIAVLDYFTALQQQEKTAVFQDNKTDDHAH